MVVPNVTRTSDETGHPHHHQHVHHHHPESESECDISLLKLSQLKRNSERKYSLTQQEQIIPRLIYHDRNIQTHIPSMRPSVDGEPPVPCPLGLEALNGMHTSLLVIRRPENAIHLPPQYRLLAFTQYDIVNENGNQIYIAVEETTPHQLRWGRDARLFNISMYDHSCRKVLTISRECSAEFCLAQYYCLCCLCGFKGCGNSTVVHSATEGEYLGKITQEFSLKDTILKIEDDQDRIVLVISGKIMDGTFDVVLPTDEDEPVALIDTSMTPQEVAAFYKLQVSKFEDSYGLTFLCLTLPPKHKALLLSAMILMDYIFCKTSSDYPHWTQFVPIDFKPKVQTHEKIFVDKSKEIIVTSLKPKQSERDYKACACCRWFFSFLCFSCQMGYTRNATRCLHLIALFFVILVTCIVLPIVLKKTTNNNNNNNV